MEFPLGFPDRLKPRAEVAIARASRKFRGDPYMPQRVRAGIRAFSRVLIQAAENGEVEVESTHRILNDFLRYLLVYDPFGPAVHLAHSDFLISHLQAEIRQSRMWIRWMERLDALTRSSDELHTGQADPTKKRATERRRAVMPVLQQKGMSPSRWADRAGVDPSVVYGYLSGKSQPRLENRKALAQAIGLPDLPW